MFCADASHLACPFPGMFTDLLLAGYAHRPSHGDRRVAVRSTGKRLRATVFNHWPLAHFAAPGSAGCLYRRVCPNALFFVQRDLLVAVFGATVLALLEVQSSENFL